MSRQQPPARAAMVDQPFRLLDLSTELRLMVYESIESKLLKQSSILTH